MKTLIILHGWQSSKERWQKVKEGIEKSGIKVIVPDLPGFKPETELQKPWSFQDYLTWVDNFIKSQNISDKFFLMGHSFGGALAAAYAINNSDKINKLILVSSSCIRRKTVKKWFLARISSALKIFSFLPFFNLARKAFYKFVVGPTDYLSAKGYLKQTFLNVISEDLSNRLSGISVPTAIIWGEKDRATLLEDAYFINKQIKNSELFIIPDKGHSLQIEAPEKLIELTSKFLND